MAIPTARGTLLPLLVAVASACSETPSPEPSPPRRTRSAPPVEPAVEAPAAPVSDLLPEADVMALKASRADDLVQRGDLAGAQRELAVVFQYLQAVGDDAPTTLLASAYYVRASLHVAAGRYREALADLEVCIPLKREAGLQDDYEWGLEMMAIAQDYNGEHAAAEATFRRLIASAVTSGKHELHGRALIGLGVNLQFQGRCEDAEPLLRLAIALLEEHSPNAGVYAAYGTLGICAADAGRLEDAVALFRRDLAERERLGHARHPDSARPHQNLAQTLEDLGRLDEALTHARAAREIRAVLPPEHPDRVASEARVERLEAVAR